MNNRGIGSRLDSWRFLLDQSRPQLGGVPHLAEDHAALEALVKEIEVRRAEAVNAYEASLESHRLRREAEARGLEARDRLAAGLVQQFGARNQKLREFGLIPKGRKAKAPKEPVPTPDKPAAAKAKANDEPPTT
jgi:hypothetical protein